MRLFTGLIGVIFIATTLTLAACGGQSRQQRTAAAARTDLVCAGDGLGQNGNQTDANAPKKVSKPLTGPDSNVHPQSKEAMARRVRYLDKAVADAKITEAKNVLAQYPTGKTALDELNGNNPKNAPIEIRLTTSDELKKFSGFDGGTIVPRKNGNTFIIASSDANPQELAQLLAHESMHVIDDYDSTRIETADPGFKAITESAALKLRNNQADQMTADEKHALGIFAADDLCLEARAYSRNLALDKEGLPIQVQSLNFDSLSSFLKTQYIDKASLTLLAPAEDLVAICLQQKTITDFHLAVSKKY